MDKHDKKIIELLDFITVDEFYVICYFRCSVKNKTVVSTVPLEPYAGKSRLKWSDIIFHPIKSYNIYFHPPVMIYGNECHETMVLKAFKKVSNYFRWSKRENKYLYN